MTSAHGGAPIGNTNASRPHHNRATHYALSIRRRYMLDWQGWTDSDAGLALGDLAMAISDAASDRPVLIYRISDPAPRTPLRAEQTVEHAERFITYAHYHDGQLLS
nr:hypothetical protein [Microbacterium lemovicicum]